MELSISEVEEKLNELRKQLAELTHKRQKLALKMAEDVGTDDRAGIHIDPLTAWARKTKKLNFKIQKTADAIHPVHLELLRLRHNREVERRKSGCTCSCQ